MIAKDLQLAVNSDKVNWRGWSVGCSSPRNPYRG